MTARKTRSAFTTAEHRELADGLLPILKPIVARLKAVEAENRELHERVITLELRLLAAEERERVPHGA